MLANGERGRHKTRVAADVDVGWSFDYPEKSRSYWRDLAKGSHDHQPLFEVILEGA
jgi:hypothetical protein